jgi:hypothetical protein
MMESPDLTFRQLSELKKFKIGQQFDPEIDLDVAERLLTLGMLERTKTGYVLSVLGEAVAKR